MNSSTPHSTLSVAPVAIASVDRGHERRLVAIAVVIAALAGVVFAMAPVSVILLAVITAFIWGAASSTTGLERRWTIGVLATAVAARLGAIAILAATTDPARQPFHSLFGDAMYSIERSLWIRNTAIGVPIAPIDVAYAFEEYGRSGFFYPLAWLQVMFGPAPYSLHVLSAVFYVAGALLVWREARAGFGPIAAGLGLGLLLWMPTIFLWSISPLKESMYFLLTSATIVSVMRVVRSRRWAHSVAALTAAAGAVAVIATLRAGGVVIVIGGVAVGLAMAAMFRYRWVVVLAIVTVPIVVAAVLSHPAVQDAALKRVRDAAGVHVGNVNSNGTNYKLLPGAFYDFSSDASVKRAPDSLTPVEAIRYLGAAVVNFVLIPKPWEPASRTDVAMIPQQLVWYVVALLALPGVVAGLRRDALLTSLLVGNIALGVAVIAPPSGNVGTLIRHRDMVSPFVMWIGALGIAGLAGWCASWARREG